MDPVMLDRLNNADAYFTRRADERDRDAKTRHDEMMRMHRDGWNAVAGAIGRGLGEIARALASRR